MPQRIAYADLRPRIRTGDLLATDARGLIEGGIRLATHGELSHVASPIELDIGGVRRLFVIEATHASGVHLVAVSRWIRERCQAGEVYWWPAGFNQSQRDAYALEVMRHLGDDYEAELDMLRYVALGKNPPPNARWYCSELDAAGRRAAQPERFLPLWPESKAVWPTTCAIAYGGLGRAVEVVA